MLLGIAGYLLCGIGLLPLVAVVVSIVALTRFDPGVHERRWMAVVGLVSSLVGILLYLNADGYL